MNNIRKDEPKIWQELQHFVAEFWEQCGLFTNLDCHLETTAIKAIIDVCAYDEADSDDPLYLCQCRHWLDPVLKDRLHRLATVVHGSGARFGFIVSKTAHQDASFIADETADIRLLTWQDFQGHFSQLWIDHQTNKVQPDAESLQSYCDPLEKHVSERLKNETDEFREKFRILSDKHLPIGMLAHRWNLPNTLIQGGDLFDALDCPDAWQFMIRLGSMLKQGLEEFDDLFNEKWRG